MEQPLKMKSRELPSEIAFMIDQLSQCLEDWSALFPKPRHSEFVEDWKNEMKNHLANTYDTDDATVELVESISTGLLEAYASWDVATCDEAVDHERIHALMCRPQTAQRTTDWYSEFKTRVSASEIYKIFGPPRERGNLVMMKAGKIDVPQRNGTPVCMRASMAPFDWGICFEPVVKLLLESEWEAMIHECGRFIHQTDPRFAASPDGLILKSKRHPEIGGHLLEIKCPKSRKIGVKIPIEYYYQMQLQMEVTDVRACEYVEAKFDFVEEHTDEKWYGKIAVVGAFKEELSDWLPSKYVYGPLCELKWQPDLGLNERVLEINMWVCDKYHHERVRRDQAWFSSLMPKLEEFWQDVEKAKLDQFVVPESTRKKKDVVCMIVDDPPSEQEVVPENECLIQEE